MRVEFPRGEVFAQLLTSGLKDLWAIQDSPYLLRFGVAANVLLLQYLLKVRPVLDAVDDVFEDLSLSLG